MHEIKDIVVVGGGLAGLTVSALLTKAGFKVLLIEKKEYPFHRVCGEYISNEVIGFLHREGLFPKQHDPPSISKFRLTSTNGTEHTIDLPLGGFGISRYRFDHFLYRKNLGLGTDVLLKHSVSKIQKEQGRFLTTVENGKQIQSKLVIGAYGKRSGLDKTFKRDFFFKRSPYVGVKYHIRTNHPHDLITLHNFRNGYCGISKIENEEYNLCYLTHRDNLKTTGSIKALENEVLFRNPALKDLFNNSDFLFENPVTINEISFLPKSLIEDGVIMCGDAAGMITPLCGNGMAIAIHSAKILTDAITAAPQLDPEAIGQQYSHNWNEQFKRRMIIGRMVQKLFGNNITSNLAVQLLKTKPGNYLVGKTHGKPF